MVAGLLATLPVTHTAVLDARAALTAGLAQVLWKSTTSVGCAVRYCPNVAGFGRGYFVQCDYSPPGNVLGQFAQNVLPK